MISVVDKKNPLLKSDPTLIENMHSLHGVITGLPPLDVPLRPSNSFYDYDNPQPLDIISVLIPEDELERKIMIPMQKA